MDCEQVLDEISNNVSCASRLVHGVVRTLFNLLMAWKVS